MNNVAVQARKSELMPTKPWQDDIKLFDVFGDYAARLIDVVQLGRMVGEHLQEVNRKLDDYWLAHISNHFLIVKDEEQLYLCLDALNSWGDAHRQIIHLPIG